MLFEAGEWPVTVEEQAGRIEKCSQTGSGVVLVAEVAQEIVASASGQRGNARRNRHSLYCGIGVVQAWVGRGVGRALLGALESWAVSHAIHRLELTVQVGNPRAIALYEKCGFEREGVKRHSLNVDGKYVDEFYMSKLIGS